MIRIEILIKGNVIFAESKKGDDDITHTELSINDEVFGAIAETLNKISGSSFVEAKDDEHSKSVLREFAHQKYFTNKKNGP